jgi:hypothetical protein
MKAIIKARSIYGETKFYPANHVAELFAMIAGTKTLTSETLRYMKALGVELELSAEASLEAIRI